MKGLREKIGNAVGIPGKPIAKNGSLVAKKSKIEVDLFEHYEKLPRNVRVVLDKYSEADTYELLDKLHAELKPLGYTFEYGLDAVPYNLRKSMSKGGQPHDEDADGWVWDGDEWIQVEKRNGGEVSKYTDKLMGEYANSDALSFKTFIDVKKEKASADEKIKMDEAVEDYYLNHFLNDNRVSNTCNCFELLFPGL